MDSNTTAIIIGFSFIFLMTSLGAAMIFMFQKGISQRMNALLLGFAAGIMVAASVWSLLIPSIEGASEQFGRMAWLPAAIGFVLGGLFLMLLDRVVPHIHGGTFLEEGPRSKVAKSVKLFLAVTIHNIPEGLSVGFAFGAAMAIGTHEAMISALGLALGIGIQNFPEGAAVSLPMYGVTKRRIKSFWYGVGSGAVEPVAALLGFFLASQFVLLFGEIGRNDFRNGSVEPCILVFAYRCPSSGQLCVEGVDDSVAMRLEVGQLLIMLPQCVEMHPKTLHLACIWVKCLVFNIPPMAILF